VRVGRGDGMCMCSEGERDWEWGENGIGREGNLNRTNGNVHRSSEAYGDTYTVQTTQVCLKNPQLHASSYFFSVFSKPVFSKPNLNLKPRLQVFGWLVIKASGFRLGSS
jgi:hypothetical protein